MSTKFTVCLVPWFNGTRSPYHITLAFGYTSDHAALRAKIVQLHGRQFGRTQVYTLTITQAWGKNSLLLKTYKNGFGIRDFQLNLQSFIEGLPGTSIDKTRFIQGEPGPLHIDTRGDRTMVGRTYQVTYSLEVL